jgi:integrase
MTEAIESYCTAKTQNGAWRKGKVADGNKRKLELFAQFVGANKAIQQISESDIERYKEAVWQVPVNFRKGKPQSTESIQVAINRNSIAQGPTLSPKAVQQHFIAVRAFFDVECRKLKLPNPTDYHLELAVSKDEGRTRPPFTAAQIQQIIDSDAFNKLSRGDKWVILFGIYTGAREAEIATIKVAEIKLENGVQFLSLPPMRDGKKFKTKDSRRRVPLHPGLVELGFIDHLTSQQAKGSTYLFPDVVYKHGVLRPNPGDAFGKRFTTLLKKIGLRDAGVVEEGESNLCFHSLRHRFKDVTINSDIHLHLGEALMGHKPTTVHSRYGKLSIEKLDEAMRKMDFALSASPALFKKR